MYKNVYINVIHNRKKKLEADQMVIVSKMYKSWSIFIKKKY